MVAENCEEVANIETRELEKEIIDLELSLRRAFTVYEPNEQLKQNPSVWVEYIEDAIERAICLLRLQKDYPNLEDAFVKLEASYQGADKRLSAYAKSRKIPGY
jgi:hypothetical protein